MLASYAGDDHRDFLLRKDREGLIQALPSVRSGTGQKGGTWQHPADSSGRRKHFCFTSDVRYRGSEHAGHEFSFRKEVIQPQVLLRLPCYDFTPIMNYTLDGCFLAVSSPASSATHFRDVTGGVYKARERIHRGVLIRDY